MSDVTVLTLSEDSTTVEVGDDVTIIEVGSAGPQGPPGDVAASAVTSVNGRVGDVVGLVEAAAAVLDGDAAGGVLAGTFPNPGFAADMATQAELDAAVASLAPTADLTAETGARVAGDNAEAAARAAADAALVPLSQRAAVNGVATLDGGGHVPLAQLAAIGTGQLGFDVATQAELDAEQARALAAEALLVPLAQRAAANGVATLDAAGKVPAAQIPAVAISDYLGDVASQAAMVALVGQRGDWCTRSDLSAAFILITDDPTQAVNWKQLPTPADAVSSVNGRAGAVAGLAEQADLAAEILNRLADVDTEQARAQAAEALLVPLAQRAAVNGVATLDGGGHVPLAQLAAIGTGQLGFDVATQAELDAESAARVAADALLAPKTSPVFTGNPTGPTPAQGDNDTSLATTAYVQTEVGLLIPKSLADAKGDLAVATADNVWGRLGVGANGSILVADSAQATGLKWATARSYVVDEVHADAGGGSSVAEQVLASLGLPGGVAAVGDVILFSAWGDGLNNTGGAVQNTWRFKIGATTVVSTPSLSKTAAGSRHEWFLDMRVHVIAINSQKVGGQLLGQSSGNAQNWAAQTPAQGGIAGGAATEDYSVATNHVLTCQLDVNSAQADVILHAASLILVKK